MVGGRLPTRGRFILPNIKNVRKPRLAKRVWGGTICGYNTLLKMLPGIKQFDLNGKVAVITGGSKGIWRGKGCRLGQCGGEPHTGQSQ
ncbi:MAG: hypothetical protein Ct9H300mP7_6520 [Verrucomicrobiota bacterium]|nr:MAG: hypothetical protein Ct9H300mP7_6520 [Verrucomicrobiota bacterium]